MKVSNTTAILLLSAPDRKGLTAFLTDLIFKSNGNIVDLQQHVDRNDKLFFMRLVWEMDGFLIEKTAVHNWLEKNIPKELCLKWQVHFSDEILRMAVFVSIEAHCLYDIISRVESLDWPIVLPLIIGNHRNLQSIAERYGITFQFHDITAENKTRQEEKILATLKEKQIDFIVLARYMQILTTALTDPYANKIINIHHSFLPAFPGSKPYHSAFQRGVKIIGASSHYVTPELDSGPIIAQDVISVTHLDSVGDFIRKGKDIEKLVLSRAISAHVQHKILVSNNRTIVFY